MCIRLSGLLHRGTAACVPLFAFAICSSAVSADELVIKKVVCRTTETVTGPDKVYVIVVGEKGNVLWDSRGGDRGGVFVTMNDGGEWKPEHLIKLPEGTGAYVQIFDSDANSPTNFLPVQKFAEKFASNLEDEEQTKDGAPLEAATISPAMLKAVAAATVAALASVHDDDDLLLATPILQRHSGAGTAEEKKDGVLARLTGNNSEYQIEYEVKR